MGSQCEESSSMGIRLSDTQWGYLKKICGGESYTCRVHQSQIASITLSRYSEVQDSYMLTYNNNIEVEIHRNTHIDSTDMYYLRELCDSWICYKKLELLDSHNRKELD